MWGLKFRFSAELFETSVPGWLLNAAATHEAITFVKYVAAELTRTPERYGFDPGNVHTLFFQTWDRAITGMQSVAFGRDVIGQTAVGLVPDAYYLASHGFSGVRDAALTAPAWDQRASTFVWRGSVTGSGPYQTAAEIPRLRLAAAARGLPNTDIKLFGVHQTMESVFSPAAITDYITKEDLLGEHWPLAKFSQYKFSIDIDGHANAWGFLEKLILGCCVLKVATPYEQWFYSRLRPWVHYIPVKADLSDLAEMIAWAHDHGDQCAWIARNGAVIAASLTAEAELPRSCATILAVSQVERSAMKRTGSVDRSTPLLPEAVLLKEARMLEGLGQLEHAISIYAHLSEAGLGGAEALMRRSSLHRERGELVLAETALNQAIARAPYVHEPRLRLAQLLMSIGRDIAAAVQLRAAMQEAPWMQELRVNFADLCWRLGWLDVAYWAIRDLPPELPDWWGRARQSAVLRFTDQQHQAMALLRARQRGQDLDHGTCWELAVCLTSLGRLSMARRLCESVAASSSDVFAPRELISKIIARQAGSLAALTYLHSLSDDMRQQDGYAVRAGRCLLDLERYEEVLDQVGGRPAIADTFDVRFTTAIALLSLGRTEALQAHCRAWSTASPDEALPAGIVCTAQPVYTEPEYSEAVSMQGIVLVQFWDKSDIPADVSNVMASWSDHHPNLVRQVYDEASARDYLSQALGAEVATAFDLCHHAAMKADLFRIGILYHSGGIWVDADERCIRPMASLLQVAARSAITAVRSGDTLGYLHNYFLAALAGGRPLEIALEMATHDIHQARRDGRELSIWEATGPGLITRAVGRYIMEHSGVDMTDVILMPLQQYNSYARTCGDLSYKSEISANWKLA